MIVTLGICTIEWDNDQQWLVTRFPDGTQVPATPNHRPEDIALATELGYPNTWEMSRDHELAHTWLAVREGRDFSPVLWAVAHRTVLPPGQADREEARVIEFQRSLDKRARRPWVVR